jgi:hypothetical protein
MPVLLNEVSWNLRLRTIMKICRKNPNLVKFWAKISPNFREDPKYFSLLPVILQSHKSVLCDENGIRLPARPSVCPCIYQRGFHSTEFPETLCRGSLCKSVIKIQIWLNSGRRIGHLTWQFNYAFWLPAILNHHKSAFLEWNSNRFFG